MSNATPVQSAEERWQLYQDMASNAQQLWLLTDILDAVSSLVDMREVLLRVGEGVKNILPTSWGAIRLSIHDQEMGSVYIHEMRGAGVSRYWSNVRSGATAAARALGVTLEFVGGGASGSTAQAHMMHQAIDARVDAIGIAPINPLSIEPLIITALSAGIPVITYDTPPIANSRSLAYIGTNNTLAGQMAGEAFRRILPAGGTIGISVDTFTAANSLQRIQGLQNVLEGLPFTMLPAVEELLDQDIGQRVVNELFDQHPTMNAGFAACGASPAYWGSAITRTQPEAFTLIGFDLSADTARMLKHGLIQVVVAQREYDMGFRTVELLTRMLIDGVDQVGATLPANRVIDTGVDLITLDRSDWSVSLADYLVQSAARRRVDPNLVVAVAERSQPLRLRVIGMAEQGDTGIAEWSERYDPASMDARTIAAGRLLIVDPQAEPNPSLDLSDAAMRDVRTLVTVPLIARGKALGVLTLESELVDACSDSDRMTIDRLSSAIAAAVENARLVSQIERRANESALVSLQQQNLIHTIMEISSPAVPIIPGILVMPLIGVIDTQRAARFIESLMQEVVNHHSAIVLIDITGVSVVDTSVANYIIQAARAAKLLGAEVILVGISPPVAQTIVQLGIDLSGISTRSDLASGFSYALTKIGGRITYDKRK